jgi:hypothetical protein
MFNLVRSNPSKFSLLKGGQEIATFKSNDQFQSLRLHSTERRLFFLSQEGLLQNKMVLKTEYGFEIGENHQVKHNKGIIHLGETKANYTLQKDSIEISDRHKKPLMSFAFPDAETLNGHELSAVLFSLMWLYVQSEISATTTRKASGLYAS